MPEAPKFWQCPRCKTPNPWASYLLNCVSCGATRPAPGAAPLFVPPPIVVVPAATTKGRVASIVSWIYLGTVVIVLALVKLLGDRWWPATMLLFGPRWLFLFPILPLLIWTGWRRRWRAVGATAASLILVLWPLMALHFPIASLLASSRPDGTIVRVLSFNRGTADLDSKAFAAYVADGRYDVVCIQEARPDPVLDGYFLTAKWNRDKAGTIWTKYPIVEDLGSFSGDAFEIRGAWPARLSRIRVRVENGREVVIANCHLPTMSNGFEGLLRFDLEWVRYYTDWRSRETDRLVAALRETAADPLILAGDFNMPPDSPIMAKVRKHYASGFESVGWGFGYTRPSRLCWIGIDRVLASPECRFLSSSVGPRVGSDHRPIDGVVIVPTQK